MAFSADDIKSKNGIKICEEAATGMDHSPYLAQGPAIINGWELKNFKEHLEANMDHETFLIFVDWSVLKRRDVINICRMFSNTIEGAPFIAHSIDKNEAIEIIQRITAFHGLHAEGNLTDGLIVLTDEKSVMFKNIIASRDGLNDAILAAEVINNIKNSFSIPVLIDTHLCSRYFSNTNIQSEGTSRGIKRTAMDDTFTAEVQQERRQQQPVPLENKISLELRKTRNLVKQCHMTAEALPTCSNNGWDKLVSE